MKTCGMCKNRKQCREFGIYGPMSNYAEKCKKFEEGLKPCPFCGRRDLDDVTVATLPEEYFVGCPTCDFGFIRPTRDAAVKKWNRRK
ncbi:MAG: Lar family restriction alleviation protein [Faecalicatena sp.]|uniref:Lar family restriction alleviation protein n=1 Tax=Faecalicatena sp. TaxID=2005360 RepID=UPI00258AF0F2|nr:Lar family restriction alleviation protein [Faecalicatena sp.]MCI6468153.1 Lar family restriction alleviation protein [Faecalicatena sp.]MDY5620407.1 hypothetical protein [Lachnospiraceae bacterium]